jgi:hypothetical protein
MNQGKASRPAPPRPGSDLAEAAYEAWRVAARAFATPGEPGFVQALDSMLPGRLLEAILEDSFDDQSRYSFTELAAVARACGRLSTYASFQQFMLVGELARRSLAASEDEG